MQVRLTIRHKVEDSRPRLLQAVRVGSSFPHREGKGVPELAKLSRHSQLNKGSHREEGQLGVNHKHSLLVKL
jgi:hypothetical protein